MDTDTGLKVLHGFLYAGVTAVYDSGNHDKYIYKMRSDSLAGRIVSPRIYATGSLVAKKNGYACCAGATTMDGFEDGKVKLDALFANKPDMLKFTRDRRGMGPRGQDLPLIPDDDFSQLIRYAKDNGVRTTIHIADEEAARLAIAAGVDALAHPVFLADASTGFAEYVADQGVVISSTALLFGAVGRVELDNTFFDDPLFTETLTEEERQFNKVTERNRYASSGMSGWMRGVLPAVLRNLKQLHDAGAIIAMGTDRLIGPMVHMEMELLAEAGIPPLDVITLSTLNGAKYIGVEAYLGSIEVGKRADMVILSKDPSVNIRNSRTIERVFINGKEIDRTQLDVAINQN
jgi:cytosine/adenosine deaminase-related metal-dependent hydrolase